MKKILSFLFIYFAINSIAYSDIDDGTGSILKLTCVYKDPAYSSTPFKVIIDKDNGKAIFGILHASANLKKEPVITYEWDGKKMKVKKSLFKKERKYKLSGKGSDFFFKSSISMKTGDLLHWVVDNTGSEQGKPGNCKRYN